MNLVYIAAPYNRRSEAQLLMSRLHQNRIDVLSRWLIVGDTLSDEGAQKDLDDINACDTLIAYNPVEWTHEGGGRHVEFGYALAQGKRLIVFGARTTIFHYLNAVEVVNDFDELLELLAPVAPPV